MIVVQANEEASKLLQNMKMILYGTGGMYNNTWEEKNKSVLILFPSHFFFSVIFSIVHTDQEPQTELAAQLAQEFYNFDMPLLLVKYLGKLDFEVLSLICFSSLP